MIIVDDFKNVRYDIDIKAKIYPDTKEILI